MIEPGYCIRSFTFVVVGDSLYRIMLPKKDTSYIPTEHHWYVVLVLYIISVSKNLKCSENEYWNIRWSISDKDIDYNINRYQLKMVILGSGRRLFCSIQCRYQINTKLYHFWCKFWTRYNISNCRLRHIHLFLSLLAWYCPHIDKADTSEANKHKNSGMWETQVYSLITLVASAKNLSSHSTS